MGSVTALCLGVLATACKAQGTAKNFTGQYMGTVGGSPVHMTLRRQGSQAAGTFRYVRAGVSLRLEGAWRENTVQLREMFGARTQTGILTAHMHVDGGLEGTWTKPNGNGALSFRARPLTSAAQENVSRREPLHSETQASLRVNTPFKETRSLPAAPPVQRRSRPAPPGQTPPALQEKDEKFLQAARQGNTTQAYRLLEQNAHLNARDGQGRTALMLACSFRNDDAEGASFASFEERLEFVKSLVARGIDVNAHSERGYTPLMYATASWGAGNPLLRMLLQAGADVNARNTRGGTALMMAVGRYGHVSTVQVLTEAGADVNLRDDAGHSALWYAKSHHAPSSARALTDAGAVE